MGDTARDVALLFVVVFLFGTLVGSALPESGNVVANIFRFPDGKHHVFNKVFLAVGVIGVVLALCLGC